MPPGGQATTELVTVDDRAPFVGPDWQPIAARHGVLYAMDVPGVNLFDRTIYAFIRDDEGRWLRGTAVAGAVFFKDILNDGSLVVSTRTRLVLSTTS